jgi:hypothetical protein
VVLTNERRKPGRKDHHHPRPGQKPQKAFPLLTDILLRALYDPAPIEPEMKWDQ